MKKTLLVCALGAAFAVAQSAHADTVAGGAGFVDNTNSNNLVAVGVVNNNNCFGFCFTTNVPMGGSSTYTDFLTLGTSIIFGGGSPETDNIAVNFVITEPGFGVGSLGGSVTETIHGGFDKDTGTVTWDDPLTIALDNGDTLDISLSDVNLTGSLGCTLVGLQACGNVNATFSLDPPAATPEPGSLALLGTSILGGVGLLRRRYVA